MKYSEILELQRLGNRTWFDKQKDSPLKDSKKKRVLQKMCWETDYCNATHSMSM